MSAPAAQSDETPRESAVLAWTCRLIIVVSTALSIARLMQAEPDVLALFASNPFPEGPPRALRATIQQYNFTRPGDPGARDGAWWRVGPPRPWSPTFSPRAEPPPERRQAPPGPAESPPEPAAPRPEAAEPP